ncbi:MAG: DUF2017 family protein [Acidimicrobiales bacterium]
MSRGPVRRTRQGDFELKLSEPERRLLGDLVEQLDAALADEQRPSDNPVLRRLFPVAHPDDPDLEASYQVLVGNDLVALRHEKLRTVRDTLEAGRIDEQALSAWMNVVNDLRLILGTHLDVSEDDDPNLLDPNHPQADTYAVYGYLGYLLDSMIESLA